MTADEIFQLSTVFVQLGVNKIRLTGGEPLVRKDFPYILEKLSSLPVKLTLTTNGVRIHEYMDLLKKNHCTSINLSLDTLNEDKFLLLTRRNHFQTVYNNMMSLVENGFQVKVNMVVMKGINADELTDFVALTQQLPIDMRFIEFMPFEGNHWSAGKVVTMTEMLEQIQTKFEFDALQHEANETAKRFKVINHKGSFAIISTMSAPFCGDCNRLRLTADGKMKNCLFSNSETDLRSALRNNEDVERLIQQNLKQKAKALGGQFDTDFEHLSPEQLKNRSMISIGG